MTPKSLAGLRPKPEKSSLRIDLRRPRMNKELNVVCYKYNDLFIGLNALKTEMCVQLDVSCTCFELLVLGILQIEQKPYIWREPSSEIIILKSEFSDRKSTNRTTKTRWTDSIGEW